MRLKTLVPGAAAAVALIAAGMLAADPPINVVIKQPFDPHSSRGGKGSPTIRYHGGAVMTQGVDVYVIYYGALDAGTQDIVNQFFTDLSSSPNYAVNSTYYDAAQATIAKTFHFNSIDYGPGTPTGSLYEDSLASQGASVGSSTVPAIISHAITTGGLPADPNGVYFVVTAPNIKVAGFCKSFCAYHTTSTSIVNGMHIRYALVPDPGQACTGCDGNVFLGQNITPNGNMGADEMTDSMIHELSEAVTDPDISAWYTSNGAENGDLCNYVYSVNGQGVVHTGLSTVPANNPFGVGAGAYYNFQGASGRYYLVQWIWSNALSPQACRAAPPK